MSYQNGSSTSGHSLILIVLNYLAHWIISLSERTDKDPKKKLKGIELSYFIAMRLQAAKF
jgi:hypothetical protein